MKKYNVGILGATGAVGKEMLKVLAERAFPIANLRLFASCKSAGSIIQFNGKEIVVEEAKHGIYDGIDIMLGAAQNKVAKEFAPDFLKAGIVFIDNSSAFRMEEEVPLVVPEINKEDILKHHGIIANPNCSTIITLVAVNAINKLSKIKAMIASTYQATSGAGAYGPVELLDQMDAIVNKKEIKTSIFPYQIASNLIPQIGSFLEDGYTTEEMKMQNEGRKIMHLPSLKVTCTCVRVPVERSHSISVTVIPKDKLTLEDVRTELTKTEGVKLLDDPQNKIYPMPLDTSNQDTVYVGRLREDKVFENGITLWCTGDQVRKGAATNAIQIAEKLIEYNA